MIEVNHLTKKYGNHVAVDDLSFTVQNGQIYGFLGPNGAGKSTTMNMITGYVGATSGEVKINGHDIYKEPEAAKKQIGYLPELPPVYDAMTVLEYLQFVAELKKIPKTERKQQITEIMELTKVTDMKNRLIQNLSKGYKQRVGLAQAILGYPEIIILDEPTVGLDPKQIIEIRELIRDLSKKHTIILSSHILSEISEVCDYVMIISHGKLVASDTPDHLSELITGQEHIEMEIKGEKEKVETSLTKVNGIETLTVEKQNEKGLSSVQIVCKKDMEPRNEISLQLGKDQLPIYSMQVNSKTLEDVFLELTADKTEATAELETTVEPETTQEVAEDVSNL